MRAGAVFCDPHTRTNTYTPKAITKEQRKLLVGKLAGTTQEQLGALFPAMKQQLLAYLAMKAE